MTKIARQLLILLIANGIYFTASSQSLGINTTGAPAASSAILDVSSTDKGLLIPRMSKTERGAITSPATGLMVFQNAPDSIGFYYYDGAIWLWLSTAKGSTGWLTTGNTGTTVTNNFFGTTDNVPLSFRQNDKWLGRWNSSNNNYFTGDSSGINTSGSNNVGLGSKSLLKNSNTKGNVAVGSNALQNNSTGNRNVAIGDSALFTQSFNAGANFLTDNTAVGSKTLFFNQPTTNANGIKNTAIGNEALYANTTGSENTALGVNAMRENTTGSANTAIGRNANGLAKTGTFNTYLGYNTGYSDSAGASNTGVGTKALFIHQKGNDNVAVGANSLLNDSTGQSNTALGVNSSYTGDTARLTVSVGYSALYYNKRNYTTAVGAYAGYSNSRNTSNNSQGTENTIMGYAALNGNASGSQNTAIGFKAMAIFDPGTYTAASPSRNVSIGDSSLNQNRGNDNVAVGYRALSSTNGAGQNQHVAIGSRALFNSTATYPNTAVGYSSQDSATTASANTSLGSFSLTSNKAGINNTAIGNAAMYEASNTSTPSYLHDNTAVGNDALRYARYYGETAIGAGALKNDTSGNYNTSVGYLSMFQNLSGYGNAAFGTFAMYKNKLSSYNTAVGYNALYNHTVTGTNYNTALGSFALENDSSGYLNTGVGTSAFRFNVTGVLNTGLGINAGYYQKQSYNTFVGAYSGVGERIPYSNYAADTAKFNTALGSYSLYKIANGNNNVAVGYGTLTNDSSGIDNVAVGMQALTNNLTGSQNTAIGARANTVNNNLTNATAIGANASVGSSNSLVLGSIYGINTALATVNVGIGENTPNARLHVTNNGASGGTYVTNASIIIEDNAQSYVQLSNPTAAEAGIVSGNAATSVRSAVVFGIDSSVNLRSGGNNSNMTVYKNGNVGIGTTTPLTKLHIYESSASNVNLRISSQNFQYEPGIELVKPGIGADWKMRVDNNSNLTFSRASDDFVSVPTNYYEMGTSYYRPATDAASLLGTPTNRWATVYAMNGMINTSDARDKENIQNIGYGLSEIMQLRPVTYNWKEHPQWGRKIGFIAQEVKPILSEVVQTGTLNIKQDPMDSSANKPTDKLGIYYSDIIPVAVKAIQEQQQMIDKQAKEISVLTETNARLQTEILLIKEKLGIAK